MSISNNFSKGDKVRFLNDVGGGEVSRIIKDGTIMVETEDGFEYPAAADDLVLIEKRTENLREKKVEDKRESPEPKSMKVSEDRPDYNVLIAFLKLQYNQTSLFLINDSPYYLSFSIYRHDGTAYHLISQDILEPDTKLELISFKQADLNYIKKIALQGIFTGNVMSDLKPAVESEIKIRPAELVKEKSFKTTDYFDDKALIYEIKSTNAESIADLSNVLEEKELQAKIDEEKSKRYKKRPDPIVWEEDLHINELVDSVVGMSNHEILTFQMNHFHKILNKAIKDKVDNVIFIHGIGNGTLKTTLRKSLEEDYKLYFEDASFKEYGFGATKVFPLKPST